MPVNTTRSLAELAAGSSELTERSHQLTNHLESVREKNKMEFSWTVVNRMNTVIDILFTNGARIDKFEMMKVVDSALHGRYVVEIDPDKPTFRRISLLDPRELLSAGRRANTITRTVYYLCGILMLVAAAVMSFTVLPNNEGLFSFCRKFVCNVTTICATST